jgi:hypothetical protein
MSITFDPFSVCSLPIIDNTRKSIEICYVYDQIYSKKLTLSYTMEKDFTLADKAEELIKMAGFNP